MAGRGVGGGWAIKKKNVLFLFCCYLKIKDMPTAIKLGVGVRGLGLNGPAIKKRAFFAASLNRAASLLTVIIFNLSLFKLNVSITLGVILFQELAFLKDNQGRKRGGGIGEQPKNI